MDTARSYLVTADRRRRSDIRDCKCGSPRGQWKFIEVIVSEFERDIHRGIEARIPKSHIVATPGTLQKWEPPRLTQGTRKSTPQPLTVKEQAAKSEADDPLSFHTAGSGYLPALGLVENVTTTVTVEPEYRFQIGAGRDRICYPPRSRRLRSASHKRILQLPIPRPQTASTPNI